jgi:hypothetical protein
MHGSEDKLIQNQSEVLKGGSRSHGKASHETVDNIKMNYRCEECEMWLSSVIWLADVLLGSVDDVEVLYDLSVY